MAAKKKAKSKSKTVAHTRGRKPTSARLLKNRPADPEPPEQEGTHGDEPPENEETEAAGEGEELETPDKPKKTKRGRQARLPQMDDPAIEELEDLAEQYAEKRDARMSIGEEEVKLKAELLDAMKKYKPNGKYVHAGVSIEVVNSKDKVKVRIKKDE